MSSIRLVGPRSTIQARLPDGRLFEAPPGTAVGDVLEAAAHDGHRGRAVAAFIGGRLRELQTPLTADTDVAPVTLADGDGTRIYRRSLALLLITAASELFPEASVFIEHSAPMLGAYYCRVRGRAAFATEELAAIEQRMREIVEANEPNEFFSNPQHERTNLFLSQILH